MLIKFTKPGGLPTYVNPCMVVDVEVVGEHTCIKTVNMSVLVIEPLEEVVRMIAAV